MVLMTNTIYYFNNLHDFSTKDHGPYFKRLNSKTFGGSNFLLGVKKYHVNPIYLLFLQLLNVIIMKANNLKVKLNKIFLVVKPILANACAVDSALPHGGSIIDNRSWFWTRRKTNYNQIFNLPDYSNHRSSLTNWIQQLSCEWRQVVILYEGVYTLDNIPIPETINIADRYTAGVCREILSMVPARSMSANYNIYALSVQLN